MKLKRPRGSHYESGPNLTPLVDVVMVILIFLMLTGRFGSQEHFLVTSTPIARKAGASAAPPPGFIPDEPLEIRVDSVAPDRYLALADGVRGSDYSSLTAQLAALRRRLVAANKSLDKIQVVILPSRSARYDHLLDVYQAALSAEFTRIGFGPGRQ